MCLESVGVNESRELRDRTPAYALLRVFLGVNIALHGISRLLDAAKFRGAVEAQFAHAPLPHPLISAFVLALPWAETVLGVLILAGLWTRIALIGGALVMIALTFGSCLIQDWPVVGIQLVYQLAYFVLLFLHNYNHWSADQLLHSGRTKQTSA